MYSQVQTAIIKGIESIPVTVEADVSDGFPVFEMVGFISAEVKESRERVRASLKNLGVSLPVKRITVNFTPANIRKSGSGFDLPIAVAILSALGMIPPDLLETTIMVGEMGLDGGIHSVNGILPIVITAMECGYEACIVPKANEKEARLVPGISVIAVESLQEVLTFFQKKQIPEGDDSGIINEENGNRESVTESLKYDFKDIRGQKLLRRACEVAAAGRHNILMCGPPGSGKSMIAKCIPGILPPMTESEMIEVSKIYSVSGLFKERESLMDQRPFRDPHHTISEPGLTGGGAIPHPGEISLAHCGVLFLDELPEFKRQTLEILRQPLEEKKVHIVRANGSCEFPSDFMLVAASNPCPCGYYPDKRKCRCSPVKVRNYFGKISQPLLDRIDICMDAPKLTYSELTSDEIPEDSKTIRERVLHVQEIQRCRFEGLDILFNSQIPGNKIQEFCPLGEEEQRFIEKRYEALSLSVRSFHRMLRVARTIADLDGSENISKKHLMEAEMYRGMNLQYLEEI